jgi:hypothetical protein
MSTSTPPPTLGPHPCQDPNCCNGGMIYTCPRCERTSHSPKDAEHGYCGACHDWTWNPEPEPDGLF